MDLQAAVMGVDLNDDQSYHDAEEADEPLDYGMKAISANLDGGLTYMGSGSAADAEDSVPQEPSGTNGHQQDTKLAKQKTLTNPDREVIAERSAEDLASPVLLTATAQVITHVEVESRQSASKIRTAAVSSARSLEHSLSPSTGLRSKG